MISKKDNFDVFRQPAFLLALLMLISNDFYLKFHYPSLLTGKLSDFAGLYVFAQFIAAVTGARITWSAIASAVFFIAWKSPLATPLIEFANRYSPLQIQRVVDYTDLAALAVLPLAVWLYDARTNWRWSFIKYPAGMLALLSIMATSVVMPTYNLSLDLQSRQDRKINIDATYAQLDDFFTRRSIQCQFCLAGNSYREYYDEQGGITIHLNHDDTDRKLFILFFARSYEPENIEKARTNKLQAELMDQLRPNFENITVARSSSTYEITEQPRSVWKLEIEAPPYGFPLGCSENGTNNPEIVKALAIVLESLDIPGIEYRFTNYRPDTKYCEADLYKDAVFGKVTGPGRYNRSISVSTRGFVGWGGTSFDIEVTEHGSISGHAHDFVQSLEERLRNALSKEIQITLTKPDTQPREIKDNSGEKRP